MMLCVDEKMLRDPLPGHESGQLRDRAETRGNGAGHLPDGDAGPESPRDRQRREVLQRVVRISDALNQRLAL
jgi:hypothetical protein